MARGSLPDQTPRVPPELFQPINDLYIWLRSLNKDVKVLEGGSSGGGGGFYYQTTDPAGSHTIAVGDRWFNSSPGVGVLFTWCDDGTTSQWVQF